MLVIRSQQRALSVLRHRGLFLRFNSSKSPDFVKKNLPSKEEWKNLKQHIPGEGDQTNDLSSRIPKFPLTKESVPTLLPRPGVPKVSPNMSFRQVIGILKNKKSPELIYEAEPHRLYFLVCFCSAVVFATYGLILLEYSVFNANKEYEENKEELDTVERKRKWAKSLALYGSAGSIMLGLSFFLMKFPTRLIRRMWYLPGNEEYVKFTSYPLLPGRATPVFTVPLKNIVRKTKGRVWTGKGFYGTSDNSMFFFILRESNPNKTWVVDRKGFFWSDGRVFDFLFGKETIAEAEAGVPYDEQIGIVNREVQKKKKELREKHGMFYQWKLLASQARDDIRSLGSASKQVTPKKLQSKKKS